MSKSRPVLGRCMRAAGLTAALLCLSVWAAPAPRASVAASGPRHADEAFAALDARARVTRAEGRLPRWSDPVDAAILSRLWDKPAILGRPPYVSADVPLLLGIGDKEIAVYKTYLLFTSQPGALPDTARNGAVFQDEIARSGAFVVALFAAQLPAIDDFVRHLKPEEMTEIRRQGLRRMRLGVTELVLAFALMIRSEDLHADNRALLVASFAEGGEAIAAGTPPKDRLAMIAQLDTVLPTLPEPERVGLARFRSALSESPCAGLCAFE